VALVMLVNALGEVLVTHNIAFRHSAGHEVELSALGHRLEPNTAYRSGLTARPQTCNAVRTVRRIDGRDKPAMTYGVRKLPPPGEKMPKNRLSHFHLLRGVQVQSGGHAALVRTWRKRAEAAAAAGEAEGGATRRGEIAAARPRAAADRTRLAVSELSQLAALGLYSATSTRPASSRAWARLGTSA